LEKNKEAKMKVLGLHHNPLWDTRNDSLFHNNGYVGRKELLSLIEEYGIDVVLDGHVHYDDVTTKNGTVYITTTTASSSLSSDDAYWGYRLIEVENYTLSFYNYKEPKFSIPSYRLNITWEDDMRARVENNLDMDVGIHLSFTVPSESNYIVHGGEVEMVRDGEMATEIYVISSLEKHSEEEIYVELI